MTPIGRAALLLLMAGLAACASQRDGAPVTRARQAAVQAWLSTADGNKQLTRDDARVAAADTRAAEAVISIDPGTAYQAMIGFGAALTDASALLLREHMSAAQRHALLAELFGRGNDGLGLSFTRLTIGASDFSLHPYSLDDRPRGESDPTLAHFALAPTGSGADAVVPVVREALAINPSLKIMASPWSAPGWMKTSDSLLHGTLKLEWHAAFAAYLIKYVEAMAVQGVPIFALSLQNEPRFDTPDYPGMLLSAGARAMLIGQHLGPALATRDHAPLIFDWDHNWDIEKEPLGVLADPIANRYVAAVAWHCYAGYVDAQTRVHDAYPDKDAYLTECSGGDWKPLKTDSLLWLTRNLIIGATRNWARGVLLWNLALDEHGGPHSGGCDTCRGVVTIDSKTGEVTRTVDYFVLAHASRFVRPGARRIESSNTLGDLDNVAFRNADDGSLVLIVANSSTSAQRFAVRTPDAAFDYAMPARSIATLVWK